MPVQGGTSTAEKRLIAAIDELDRKKEAYRATKRKVDAVERGLATLTAQQVDILDRFFIHRTRGHVDSLAADYHIERTRVYDLKDAAIDDFTIARYGIIDS